MESKEFAIRFLDVLGKVAQHGTNPLKLYPTGTTEYRLKLQYPMQLVERLFDMASKKQAQRYGDLPAITFMNYNMDKREKEDFNKWLNTSGNDVINAVRETLEASYKFSLSYDPEKEVFLASLTGKPDSLNPGRCLTVRSADWQRAYFALAFIHMKVFDGEIWNLDATDNLV